MEIETSARTDRAVCGRRVAADRGQVAFVEQLDELAGARSAQVLVGGLELERGRQVPQLNRAVRVSSKSTTMSDTSMNI